MQTGYLEVAAVILGCSIGLSTYGEAATEKENTIEQLVEQLEGKARGGKHKAAYELLRRGNEARAAIPALTKALGDNHRYVRIYSAKALAKMKAATQVQTILDADDDAPKPLAAYALHLMDEMPEAQLAVLRKLLTSESRLVRERASEAIGEIGAAAARLVPDLITATKNGNIDAVIAISKMAEAKKQAIPLMISILSDPGKHHEVMRVYASQILGHYLDDEKVLKAVCGALSDPSYSVRTDAAARLRKCPERYAERAAKALVKALESKNRQVWWAAKDSLIVLGAPSMPHVVRVLDHDERTVRWCALTVLTKLAQKNAIPKKDVVAAAEKETDKDLNAMFGALLKRSP